MFHGNRLDFGFWDKEMLIAIHTGKDMFETTSLFTPALDYKKVQEVICQIYSIFEVIDVFVAKGKQIGKKKRAKKLSSLVFFRCLDWRWYLKVFYWPHQ